MGYYVPKGEALAITNAIFQADWNITNQSLSYESYGEEEWLDTLALDSSE